MESEVREPMMIQSDTVDMLAQCSEIRASTKRGILRALDLARENGRDFPSMVDVANAAHECRSSLGAVAAAWGYARDEDRRDVWHDARFTYEHPERDDFRRATVDTHEALLALILFSLGCSCPIPFQLSYATRKRE
jgi:hypothetical protein